MTTRNARVCVRSSSRAAWYQGRHLHPGALQRGEAAGLGGHQHEERLEACVYVRAMRKPDGPQHAPGAHRDSDRRGRTPAGGDPARVSTAGRGLGDGAWDPGRAPGFGKDSSTAALPSCVSIIGREEVEKFFGLANLEASWMIEIKGSNARPADRCLTHY
jgi:hypothetical protein